MNQIKNNYEIHNENNNSNNDTDNELYIRCNNALTLQLYMEKQGFIGLESEWWHFDSNNWKNYDLLDISFDDIKFH